MGIRDCNLGVSQVVRLCVYRSVHNLFIHSVSYFMRFVYLCQYIVTCIPIARQRLGIHIPKKRTRATEGSPLLGNGPVNTSP
jgi:hypothetical protein